MNFVQAMQSGFQRYLGFHGRARRGEFWLWALFWFLCVIAAATIDEALFPNDDRAPFGALIELVLFLPGLAMAVRRLHDTGRSGWLWLLLLTFVGLIPLMIWWCEDGQAGPNVHGADPKGRAPQPAGPLIYPAAFAAAPYAAPTPPIVATPATLQAAVVSPVSGLPDAEFFGQLERLGRLRDDGVLTATEFDAAKSKLMAGR